MNRKLLIIGSGLVSFGGFLALFYSENICGIGNVACLDATILAISPVVPLFIFSLIGYFFRSEIYQAWFRFSRWWIPLSVGLALITPDSGGGGFGPSISIGKPDVALVMSAVYIIVSTVIILAQYIRTRKR